MNWQEVDLIIKNLAQKCTDRPEVIVAIARGGLVPARLLAKYLNVKEMYCLTVNKEESERVVANSIKSDLTKKTVLLVEDVLESAKSLVAAKQYLEQLGADVKTAAIYYQSESIITPDYFIAQIDKVPIFPWD